MMASDRGVRKMGDYFGTQHACFCQSTNLRRAAFKVKSLDKGIHLRVT